MTNRFRILLQLRNGARVDVPFLDSDSLILHSESAERALETARVLGKTGSLIAVQVDESDRIVEAA